MIPNIITKLQDKQSPIKVLIADDNREVCDSMEKTLETNLELYGLTKQQVQIRKVFTEHAYEHGCTEINHGFIPDICIFDLVFNGYTGVDLYRYLIEKTDSKNIWLCIYTGVEKKYEKRKDAESLASQMQGRVEIVAKPKIDEITGWFNKILESQYDLTKIIDDGPDFFDML